MTFVEFCQTIRDYAGDKHSLKDTIDEINGYTTDIYTKCDIPAKYYVREYLEALKKAGTRMCVCSATEENRIEAVLNRLGLWDYFEFVITVADVGCGKSKPKIFIEAAKRFGTEDYTGITVYEDLFAAMQSAKSQGFCVVGIYDEVGQRQIEAAKEVCDIFSDGFETLYRRFVKIQQVAKQK
jgi:HAD superfamily hydrolase (TIGR01509 family)